VLSYNEFWYERGDQMTADRRTSLIVDPPDGRIPFSAEARTRMADRANRNSANLYDSYEDLSLAERCILSFNSGPPMVSSTYNNNLQIVQTPGYVVIFTEMVHDARIVPTDGRPHSTLARWSGESRGRWEGETLVVETFNFKRETSLQGSIAPPMKGFVVPSTALHGRRAPFAGPQSTLGPINIRSGAGSSEHDGDYRN
jgi:hypothetical protein